MSSLSLQAPVFRSAADAFGALTRCFDASFETIVNLMVADSFKRFSVSAICSALHAELQSKQVWAFGLVAPIL